MDLAFEKRLNTLLSQAFERPTGERRQFVEAACARDGELLSEALSVLELGSEPEIEPPPESSPSPATTVFERHRPPAGKKPPGISRPGAGPPAPRPPETPTPLDIGHYRVLGRLGRGGMGMVYLAEDTRLGRRVALKFLLRELIDTPEAKARFLREARAASRLDHPNLCNIHEIGEAADGRLYIVMAHYEGETLRHRMARGPLPLGEALRITRQVAAGLGKAHREGIVHRDVKPSNVFLTADGPNHPGWVKVLDFGIAKLRGDVSLTVTGLSVGTPLYMAPEQALGDSDHRADLWALGVILYEMLTGERPFAGDDPMSVMQAALHDPLPPLAERRPDLPAALGRVVERALAKDPDDRFQSAEALADALPADGPVADGPVAVGAADVDAADGGRPTASVEIASEMARSGAPDPEAPAEGVQPVRRRLLPWAVAAIAAASLVAAGLYWSRQRPPADAAPPPAAAEAPTAIAVLPFTVRGGGDYDYLREGVVDLLSTKLDGAGDLRAIDSQALFQQLEEQPIAAFDPGTGAGIARRLDADMMILGDVFEVAGQLRIDAVLYRVDEAGGPPARVAGAAAEGPAAEIFSLVDDLATQLLAGMEGGAARMRRLAAMTSDSFPALKAYLEGESAWRAGRFGDAARAFGEAVAEDPQFALAWYRLSLAHNWLMDLEGYSEALQQAVRHGERLTPDDRRLLDVAIALNRGDAVAAERLCREVLSRRPDDLEAWSALAEVEFHLGPVFGHSLKGSRRSWERVLEIEPDDRQALIHLARLDAHEQQFESLATRAERLVVLLQGSERASEPLFFRAILPGAGEARRTLRDELLGSELGIPWLAAAYTVGSSPEYMDFRASLYRELLAPERAPREQTFGHRHVGIIELAAGRLEAADGHLRAATHPPEQDQEHRALAATLPFLPVPEDRLRGLIAAVEAWPIRPTEDFSLLEPHARFPAHHRLYLLALLVARAGDDGRALGLADELAALGEIDSAPGLARDLELGVHAEIAWRAGRYARVLELLAERHGRYSFEMPMVSPLFSQSRERYLKAEALYRLGRLEEADAWFETLSELAIFDLAYLAVSHLRRGEIAERLGEPERAAEHTRRFVELWADSDPVLAPRVEEARRRLAASGS